MISRRLNDADFTQLENSLLDSSVHRGTPIGFFKQENTISTIYEDSQGPVLVIRGAKSLRLDIHFLDDNAVLRNGKMLVQGFESVMNAAKASGFTEVIFDTKNVKLKEFCEKRFGFKAVIGETLRKEL